MKYVVVETIHVGSSNRRVVREFDTQEKALMHASFYKMLHSVYGLDNISIDISIEEIKTISIEEIS